MAQDTTDTTNHQLRQAAIDALPMDLGYPGPARHLQDQSNGNGEYTKDRWQWLTEHVSDEEFFKDVKETAARARKQRVQVGDPPAMPK